MTAKIQKFLILSGNSSISYLNIFTRIDVLRFSNNIRYDMLLENPNTLSTVLLSNTSFRLACLIIVKYASITAGLRLSLSLIVCISVWVTQVFCLSDIMLESQGVIRLLILRLWLYLVISFISYSFVEAYCNTELVFYV